MRISSDDTIMAIAVAVSMLIAYALAMLSYVGWLVFHFTFLRRENDELAPQSD